MNKILQKRTNPAKITNAQPQKIRVSIKDIQYSIFPDNFSKSDYLQSITIKIIIITKIQKSLNKAN